MYVYIYVYAHARTHAPRARGRRRRRRRRVEYEPATPRTPRRGSTPNGNPPRGRTRRQNKSHDTSSSDDSAHCRASLDRVEKSYARWSSSVTSGAPPDVVRTCGTVIFFFTGERRTRSGACACARECAHRTRRRTHATHGGCPPPRVDDVGARD